MPAASSCLVKISTTLEIAKVAVVKVAVARAVAVKAAAVNAVVVKVRATVRSRVTVVRASRAMSVVRSPPALQLRVQPRSPVANRSLFPARNPAACSAGLKAFSAPRPSPASRPSPVPSPNRLSPVKAAPMATVVVVVAVVAVAPAAALPKVAPAAHKALILTSRATVRVNLPTVMVAANIVRRAKVAVVVVAVVAGVAPVAVKAARVLRAAAIVMMAAAPASLPQLKPT